MTRTLVKTITAALSTLVLFGDLPAQIVGRTAAPVVADWGALRDSLALEVKRAVAAAGVLTAPGRSAPAPPIVLDTQPALPPSGVAFPHQPAGWTVLFEQPWQSLPGSRGNGWGANSSTRIDIATDRHGTISPPYSLRHRVPKGTSGRAGGLNTWTPIIPDRERHATEVYFAVEHIWSENWVNHAIGLKDLWPNFERERNSPYTSFSGGNMRVDVNFQGEPWGNRNLRANVGPDSHRYLYAHRGKPVLIEYYMRVNTTNQRNGSNSRANGIVRTWVTVDGISHMVMDYDDVKFFEIDSRGQPVCGKRVPCGTFRSLRLNPTYGGGGSPAPYEMERWIAHIRVAVPSH